jgi:hypothetical protein
MTGAEKVEIVPASFFDSGATAGAASGAGAREKSTPASEAPQMQRARVGAFSAPQTGQTRM